MPRPTPADIVAQARRWEGAPYRHEGRTRHGVDCAGFIIVPARDAGVFPPDFNVRGYPRTADGTIRRWLMDAGMVPVLTLGRGERLDVSTLQIADVLLMGDFSRPHHLALWDGECMMHASNSPGFRRRGSQGRVVRHSLRPPFIGEVRGVYRYPGIANG